MASLTLTVPNELVAEIASALWPNGKPLAGDPPAEVSDGVAIKMWIKLRIRDAVAARRLKAAQAAALAATNPDLDGIS